MVGRRLGRTVLAGLVAVAALVGPLTAPAMAHHGDLDASFGTGGKVEHELGGGAGAGDAVLRPDGRLLVAGVLRGPAGSTAVALARFSPTGTLEAWTSTTAIGTRPTVTSLALFPDGAIAVAGDHVLADTDSSAFVARFTPALALDATFDGDGVWRSSVAPTGADRIEDLAVDGAGRLVATGELTATGGGCAIGSSGACHTDLVVARFSATGIDGSFGTGGIARLDLAPGMDDSGHAALVQPDGRILVTGENRTSGSSTQAVVVRLLDTGAADPSFGMNGISRPVDYYSSFWRGTALALTPDGRILLGVSVSGDGFVARLTSAGALDGGWESPILFGGDVVDLHLRSDGRVVVGMVGWAMFVTRLLPTGSEDSTFLGTRAVLTSPFHPYDRDYGQELLASMLVRPDGRIVVVGSTVWRVGDPYPENFHYGLAAAQYVQEVPASPPTAVTASAGDARATVGWSPPADSGGLPIDGYVVTVVPGGETRLPASARSYTAAGLANGASYRFAVRAVTAQGDGETALSPVVTPQAPPPPPPPPAPPKPRQGYWMVGRTGSVFSFGDAPYLGGGPAPADVVDLEPTPSGNGYWRVTDRGHVYTSGDAPWLGGTPSLAADERVTSISRSGSGAGYWLFTTKGRVIPFGDAPFLGDMSGTRLNGPVLDSIPTPSGGGYFMVASDGGIFTFGDARFQGSMGALPLNAPVQSLVPDPDGAGYWLVASDGGIFAFDAPFFGSMGSTPLNRPVTGMVGFAGGYLMVGEDGGIFAFGRAPFFGSLGDAPPPPSAPIVAVAVLDQP